MGIALDAVLGEVLARTGARTVRVVDGRTRAVVAMAGVDAGDDIVSFAQLTALAALASAADGGLDDVVVGARDAVHVLRKADAMGSVVHVRLDHTGGDVAAARSALASPTVLDAVRTVLPRPSPHPVAPHARHSSDPTPVLPRPATSGPGRQPALSALDGGPRTGRTGELAVIALTAEPRVPLPRRAESAPPALPPVLDRSWSRDMSTMRRLLEGLRRLS